MQIMPNPVNPVKRLYRINTIIRINMMVICAVVSLGSVRAQVRGVYPLGMSATNSGVTPASGFTYSNQLLIYSRDQFKGPNGEVLATGNNAVVVMDMNTLTWVR